MNKAPTVDPDGCQSVHQESSTAVQQPSRHPTSSGQRRRVRFTTFLTKLSNALTNATRLELDREVSGSLRELARVLAVDRVRVFECKDFACRMLFEHRSVGRAPALVEEGWTSDFLQWLTGQFASGRAVVWARIPQDIPAAARATQVDILRLGAQSLLAVPVRVPGAILVVEVTTSRRQRSWTPRSMRHVRLVGEVLAGAMLRRRDSIEYRRRFEALFQSAPIGAAVVSIEGRWLEVNTTLARMLGYSPDELRNLTFQALTHPEDLQKDLAQLQRTLAGEIDHYGMEKRYIRKDGRTVPAVLSATLVRDADGFPLYFIGHVQDMTECDRFRSDLAHAARVQLSDYLTPSLAHQMRQPFTAILSNVEAGANELGRELPDLMAVKSILSDIGRCGIGATAIIEQIVRFLRKEPRGHERVDLHDVIREALAMLRGDFVFRQTRVELFLRASKPVVRGDALQLQQVIVNLVVNASTAMKELKSERRTLVIATENRGPELEISVQDRGPGVPVAELPRLFDPFRTTKTAGMGMGLYFAQQIVRSHGGQLWAKNNERSGLTQRCRLPRALL